MQTEDNKPASDSIWPYPSLRKEIPQCEAYSQRLEIGDVKKASKGSLLSVSRLETFCIYYFVIESQVSHKNNISVDDIVV